jgi:hypothetical protein
MTLGQYGDRIQKVGVGKVMARTEYRSFSGECAVIAIERAYKDYLVFDLAKYRQFLKIVAEANARIKPYKDAFDLAMQEAGDTVARAVFCLADDVSHSWEYGEGSEAFEARKAKQK